VKKIRTGFKHLPYNLWALEESHESTEYLPIFGKEIRVPFSLGDIEDSGYQCNSPVLRKTANKFNHLLQILDNKKIDDIQSRYF
jgi:hypothetical protein